MRRLLVCDETVYPVHTCLSNFLLYDISIRNAFGVHLSSDNFNKKIKKQIGNVDNFET